MKQSILLITAIVILSACSEQHINKEYKFDEVTAISTVLTPDSSLQWGGIWSIKALRNNTLLITGASTYVRIGLKVDSDSVKPLPGFRLVEGRGPREFLSSSSIAINIFEKDNRYMICGLYDNRNLFLSNCSADKEKFEFSKWIQEEYPNSIKFYCSNIAAISNTKLILTKYCSVPTPGEISPIYILDINNPQDITPLIFNFPMEIENDSIPKYDRFNGYITSQPNGNKFIYNSFCSEYAFLFEIKENRAVVTSVLYDVLPQLNIHHTQGGDGAIAYLRSGANNEFTVSVTDKYIYLARFDPKNYQYGDDYVHPYSNEIDVFDWEGNPQKRIKLDKFVICFSVAPNDEYIYGSRENEETGEVELLRFDIP